MAWTLVWLAAGWILYVVALYPLWLDWRARRAPRPVRKLPERKTVSILLPVRNGEAWIRPKLESILQLDYPRQLLEILVISDGSTDGTEAAVREYAGRGVTLLALPPGGKAVALNAGLAAARNEILFFTDVRQPLDPACLKNLVDCFGDPAVGVASGELIILDGESHEEANIGLYWKYEKWIRTNQSRIDSIPGATGSVYAMRRELAVPLPPDTLLDDVYLPLAAFFRGYRLIVEPGAKAFDYPTALKAEFSRKVRTLAGVYQVIGRYPGLLTPSNRMLIHFLSHKFGRLTLPFALIALLAASCALPAPWAVVAVSLQAGFYALAALDPRIPAAVPVKRFSSVARIFTALMAAALCAPAILFVPARFFWKDTRGARR